MEEERESCVDDLPEFVLEYVFTCLNSYEDFDSVRLVSRRWCRVATNAAALMQRTFRRCEQFHWWIYEPSMHLGPTERCSHSACYHPRMKAMYVFGGCTATYTAFNDLWRFNLSDYSWSRVLITKAPFPSPKALATLLPYRDDILLYGGFSKSSPNPIHQTSTFYNELHLYSTSKNQWIEMVTENSAPRLASHSASIVGDCMIVFGGSMGIGSSNELWMLDIPERLWLQPQLSNGRRPAARYGHSQVLLDNRHLLIVGGCGGPNMIYADAWILHFDVSMCSPWSWKEVKITNAELAAPQLWCHAACRVGHNLLVLSRPVRNTSHTGTFKDMRIASHPTPLRVRSSAVADRRPAARSRQPTSSRSVAESPPYAARPPGRNEMQCAATCSAVATVTNEGGGGLKPSLATRRRGLLSSKSLDEQANSSGAASNSGLKVDSKQFGGTARTVELQRARSIPAIIVGEIPTLVVTSSEACSSLNRHSPPMARGNVTVAETLRTEDSDVHMSSNGDLSSDEANIAAVGASRETTERNDSTNAFSSCSFSQGLNSLQRRHSDTEGSVSEAESSGRGCDSRGTSSTGSLARCSCSGGSDNGSLSPPVSNTLRRSSSGSLADGRRNSLERLIRRASPDSYGHRLLCAYVLDISRVVSHGTATWHQHNVEPNAPEDTILYSICAARGEAIVFGGMRSDGTMEGLSPFTHSINNKTIVLRPRYYL